MFVSKRRPLIPLVGLYPLQWQLPFSENSDNGKWSPEKQEESDGVRGGGAVVES